MSDFTDVVSTDEYDDHSQVDEISSFGGESDPWSSSLTTEVMNGDFSVVFDADVGEGILRVDEISIEVFFTLPFGGLENDLAHADSGLLACAIGQNDGVTRFAVGGVDGRIKTSDDFGETWVERDTPVVETIRGITFGGGKFVAVGDNGVILESVGGETWAEKDSETTSSLLATAYNKNNDSFTVAGMSGVIRNTALDGSWEVSRF